LDARAATRSNLDEVAVFAAGKRRLLPVTTSGVLIVLASLRITSMAAPMQWATLPKPEASLRNG
jgi:hypothetical protein